jgi:6-pyruvoyltetrahydropterin/6-carboxytetrahydropterin synthase
LRLSKRFAFSASHRLHSGRLSDQENRRLFGKCNNPFGHGHNYVLEVSVSGPPDPRTGMVVPRSQLDAVVEHAVLADLDHANLNQDLPEFNNVVPTTENLALFIDRRLRHSWQERFGNGPVRLEKIRIEETPRNSFEVVSEPT